MPLKAETLKAVMQKCQPLVAVADSLQLASVAKAIEQQRPCQIFMQPFSEEDARVANSDCFTAHCEPFFIYPRAEKLGKPDLEFVQHFIFYKSSRDTQVERWRIAHELGHSALHWPVEDRESRSVSRTLPGIGRSFLVRYTEQEEAEADAFACLLSVHRPGPPERSPVVVNQEVFAKLAEYASKGILQSAKGSY